MREILFRGKRTDNGEWVEGSLVLPNCELNNGLGLFCEGKAYICISLNFIRVSSYEHREFELGSFVEVDPDSVSQYTGLCDKNGKKIFEGDIVETNNGRNKAVSVVKYGNFRPSMFYDLLKLYMYREPRQDLFGLFLESEKEQMFLADSPHIEVIGNIHDNPELLKGAENEL